MYLIILCIMAWPFLRFIEGRGFLPKRDSSSLGFFKFVFLFGHEADMLLKLYIISYRSFISFILITLKMFKCMYLQQLTAVWCL